MEHPPIILHEMPGWEESADRPVMAAPVLRPGDVFPPRPPGSGGRRGRRWPIWVAVVVVLAIVGGVVGYAATRKSTASSVDQVAAVRKAYLAWWDAAKQAYLRLDPSPMRPFMTADGYERESTLLAQQQKSNQPLEFN